MIAVNNDFHTIVYTCLPPAIEHLLQLGLDAGELLKI